MVYDNGFNSSFILLLVKDHIQHCQLYNQALWIVKYVNYIKLARWAANSVKHLNVVTNELHIPIQQTPDLHFVPTLMTSP